MASLHKDPRGKSPYWYCAYQTSDGVRHFRSTKTTDKRQAVQICNTWAKASALGDKLTPDRARQVIAAGVADVLSVSGDILPSATVGDWCNRWLALKEVENEPATHERYALAIEAFKKSLGSKMTKDLNALTVNNILEFRDTCAKILAPGTANTHLKIVRACLNSAYKQGLVSDNVAAKVSGVKDRRESQRRSLSMDELQTVLQTCADTPWRGLVLVGLYTGQRLGDCARLTWGQVDLFKKEISFTTGKTGKKLSMRMAAPLADYLTSLPTSDVTTAPVFPRFAQMAENRVSQVSTAFAFEVLIPAGLMAQREDTHKSTGKGRSGKRRVNPVTFHSLRHSFVTMLKAAGASNAMAQMIVGHDSAAVNARYTHLSAADTADPIAKLPDLTKTPAPKKDK